MNIYHGDHEHEIIELLTARINQGRKEYGPWNVNDGRDYVQGTLEEVLDGLLYIAAQLIKLKSRSYLESKEK